MKAGKTFRVFISSTFSDLKAERNALQRHVFPRLQELCAAYGTRFQAIDLRWGVSAEAGLDQRTMRLCLEELRRCQSTTPKPNFIVLLGDRYGWEPLPFEIPCSQFREIRERLGASPGEFDALAAPSGMSANALLDQWYRCDENSVPPVYVLQPRTGEFVDTRVWDHKAERPLRNLLRTAVRDLGLDEDALLPFEASATHQEIRHGAIALGAAAQHVFGYFRKILNLGLQDGEEIPATFEDYVDSWQDDTGKKRFAGAAHARAEKLKVRLETTIGGSNVRKHGTMVTDVGMTMDHIGDLPCTLEQCLPLLDAPEAMTTTLCRQVWRDLGTLIRSECQSLREADPLHLQTEAHAAFREERARVFVGRKDLLDEVERYLDDDRRQPLVLHGTSGSGKSALLARAAASVARRRSMSDVAYCPGYQCPVQRPDGSPVTVSWKGEAILVERFIGATPASTQVRSLLVDFCRILDLAYDKPVEEPPEKLRELVESFHGRLKRACHDRPLIIFLDALDQLSEGDDAMKLEWLPTELPPCVKLIVSTVSGAEPAMARLRGCLPDSQIREVMPLSPEDGGDILEALLADCGRTVTAPQRAEVLEKFAVSGLPLYLKLAFEEARRWRSWEGVPSYEGMTGLAPRVEGVIGNLFWRLSRPQEHGPLLVERCLGFLAASRHGLTEDELLEVLSGDREFFAAFQSQSHHHPTEDRVPVVVWSRLYHDLEPYLTWRAADGTELLGFYHGQLSAVVKERLLQGEKGGHRHRVLADFFRSQPLHSSADGEALVNLRKVSELLHQEIRAEDWPSLQRTATDFAFLAAKCQAGLHRELASELEHSSRAAPTPVASGLVPWAVFFRQQGHLLARGTPSWPSHRILLQLALEEPRDSPVLRAADRFVAEGGAAWPRLHAAPRPGDRSHRPCLRTLESRPGGAYAAVFASDGSLAASVGGDGQLRIWSIADGACERTVPGGYSSPWACRETALGGGMVAVACRQGIDIWDTRSGTRVRSLRGVGHDATALAAHPDGRRLVSGGSDGGVRVWDWVSGVCLLEMKGHPDEVTALSLSPDGGRLASACRRETIIIWNIENGIQERRIHAPNIQTCHPDYHPEDQRHCKWIRAVAVLSDGQRLLTGDDDCRLRLWDMDSGVCLRTIEGLPGPVMSLATMPDGVHVACAAEKSLQIWNVDEGRRTATLTGHTGGIWSVAASSDGRLMTASSDGTVKVWEPSLQSSPERTETANHPPSPVVCLALGKGGFPLSTHKDGTIRTWFADGSACRSTLPSRGGAFYQEWIGGLSGTTGQRALAWRWLVPLEPRLPRLPFELTLLDLATGYETTVPRTDEYSRVRAVAMAEDGAKGYAATTDRKLEEWDLRTLECARRLPLGFQAEHLLRLEGQGHVLAVDAQGGLHVVDLDDGASRSLPAASRTKVSALVLLEDGRIAVGCDSGTILLVDTNRGETVCEVNAHQGSITSLAVLPGGGLLASTSSDRTLGIWDLRTLSPVSRWDDDSVPTACVALSATSLAVGDEAGLVRVLRLVR